MKVVNKVVDIELEKEECEILCKAMKTLNKIQNAFNGIDTSDYNKSSKNQLNRAIKELDRFCGMYDCTEIVGINDYDDID